MKIQELLELGKKTLSTLEEGNLEARILLEFTLNCDHQYILMNQTLQVDDDMVDRYIGYIETRKDRKPIQHIMGMQGFHELMLKVNEHTLIPRQETEILVEFVLDNIDEHDVFIVDIGTGSGCIPIAICHSKKQVKAIGLDISKEALEVAAYNAGMYELEDRITFLESNLLSALNNQYYGKVNILISNPPYIPTDVIQTLNREVKDYEPILALDGGEDGLDYYRLIIRSAINYLQDDGLVVFEVGHDQADAVIALFEENGYNNPAALKDYAGIRRVVYATWNKR